jgi:hypothetical protein
LPHVAAAGEISVVPIKEHVTVDAWFCPGTVANWRTGGFTFRPKTRTLKGTTIGSSIVRGAFL